MEDEYLKVYLDNIKQGMQNNKQVDLPDEFIAELYEKYAGKNNINQHEIVDLIQRDIQKYLGKDETVAIGKEEKPKEENMPKESSDTVQVQEATLAGIATAKTPEELQSIISVIPNMDVRLKDLDLGDDEFNNIKRGVFELYKDKLSRSNLDISSLKNIKIENYNQIDDLKAPEVEPNKVQKNDDRIHNTEQKDLNIMFNDVKDNVSQKKEQIKETGKVLMKTPKEQGFAYSPAINIMILLLLFAFFIIAALALA